MAETSQFACGSNVIVPARQAVFLAYRAETMCVKETLSRSCMRQPMLRKYWQSPHQCAPTKQTVLHQAARTRHAAKVGDLTL